MTQERVQKQKATRTNEDAVDEVGVDATNQELAEKTADVLEDIDDVLEDQFDEELLADMDNVLEANAEEFVQGYIQTGGQ